MADGQQSKLLAASQVENRDRFVGGALEALAAILLVLVLIQCVLPINTDLTWTVDPTKALAAQTHRTISPTMYAWVNTGCVMVAALTLLAHVWVNRRVHLWSLIGVAPGIAISLHHQHQHGDNMLRCGGWAAAGAVGLAAVHLAQHPRCRRLITAALAAMLVPLFVDAIWWVVEEHPATLEYFAEHEDGFLENRGWLRDSAMHQLYSQRMQQPDVIGAFGLSNVFGSIAGAVTLIAFAMTLRAGSSRPRRPAPTLIFALTTLTGAATIYLTHSKGAMLATLACAMLAVAACLGPRLKLARLVPPAALVLVVGAVIAVVVRGMIGAPSTHEGERSLLFRAQYWQGAVATCRDMDTLDVLMGTGPAKFGYRYLKHKVPISPEEVQSTHNVFLDYTIMLGPAGAMWCAVLVGWLWLAARRVGDLSDDDPPASDPPVHKSAHQSLPLPSRDLLAVCTVAGGVMFWRHFMELGSHWWGAALARLAGLVGWVAVLAMLHVRGWFSWRGTRIGLFAAATLLLMHNQIETTFFQQGAVAVGWLIMGIAAGGGLAAGRDETTPDLKTSSECSTSASGGVTRFVPALLMFVFAVVMVVMYVIPTAQHERAITRTIESASHRHLPGVLSNLDDAIVARPHDPGSYEWKVNVLMQVIAGAQNEQMRDQALAEAWMTVEKARDAGLTDLSLARSAVQLHLLARDVELAIKEQRRIIERAPYSLMDHLALSDMLWRHGSESEAAISYAAALRVHQDLYLDPLRQLPAGTLELVRTRAGGEILSDLQ